MSSLTAADLRKVLALVGEANDAEDIDDFRSFLLPALRRLIPADYASYNEIGGDGRVVAALVEPELPQEVLNAWAEHALDNPLVARFALTRDGRPYRFSDVMDVAELRRLPFYRGFLQMLGLEYQIAFALPSPSGFVRGIALARAARDFSDREREMLDVIRPHLVQAYRNAVLRTRAAGVSGSLAEMLEHLGDPAALLDETGRVMFATPAASRLLDELGGGVGAPLPPALRAGAGETEPCVIARESGPLVVRPLTLAHQARRVVVFESDARLEPKALTGFGLTSREGEVLEAFAAGRSPREVAAALGISVRTVHKHTQRIHAKLGTRDRAQAVATAHVAVRTRT